MTKSETRVILSVIHHRQNRLGCNGVPSSSDLRVFSNLRSEYNIRRLVWVVWEITFWLLIQKSSKMRIVQFIRRCVCSSCSFAKHAKNRNIAFEKKVALPVSVIVFLMPHGHLYLMLLQLILFLNKGFVSAWFEKYRHRLYCILHHFQSTALGNYFCLTWFSAY
jgi:hypothetical protein